ncbi:MAG: zinc ribbon domain-containing protein [Deltaproteobacteria bacterium]|nr:zinc ribbon domain-containing protein [Deltaproteobacteria bacterium]
MTLFVQGGPACQSCGAPMMTAKEHGGGRADNAYCACCTDKHGALLSLDAVIENMATERFMKVNKMPRAGALEHARRAVEAMPHWQKR